MDRLIPLNSALYDGVYGSEFPTEQFFVIKYDFIPSRYTDNTFYDISLIDYLTSIGFKTDGEIEYYNRRSDLHKQFLMVNDDKKIIIRLYNEKEKDSSFLLKMDFYYDYRLGDLKDRINFGDLKKHSKKKRKSNINLVKSDMGHLDTEEYDLFSPKIDLALNYGEDFLKIHNTIVKKLNEQNGKGIILLHGDPGTGKTSYIKHLTTLVKEKDILFIPPSMAEMLSEPTIIPFLMDHKNSILIIEDGERVISDREYNGSSAGVSNILNLTDGILGDCLSIQIVATFNMKKEKIDKALLRKGRLIAEHKFEKLSVDETNKLLKKLGKDYISDEPMSLADIYNIDIELFRTEDKTSKIGF